MRRGRLKVDDRIEAKHPITSNPIPAEIESFIERYPLTEPYLYVTIAEDPVKRTYQYLLDEVKLTTEEARIYNMILDVLQFELRAPRTDVDPKQYFAENAGKIIEKYKISMGSMPNVSWATILYYAERDMVGLGPLDPFMRDPNVEDISIDGVNKPVYIWHRQYESLESNLWFEGEKELDDTISRLVHLSGKHISTAYPVVDATLPGRHRLSATFRREVTPYGGTLTIRKFREDPVTIVDMLNFGTISHEIAAYAWLVMENRSSSIIVGATASGKTTFLNALLSMARPSYKIVTIEEVQEINIPHENWVAMTSRPSYGLSSERIGEVSLFDLVKAAMRMRPDLLVVGEVRGEEAYVLFQAISTGHGGMCTLHAEEVSSALQRLTSKPMDVAPAHVAFLDLVFLVRRVSLPSKKRESEVTYGRRVTSVDEVISYGEYVKMFEWDARTDRQVMIQPDYSKSANLRRISKDLGKSIEELTEEIERRTLILRWMQAEGVRYYKEVGSVFEQYFHKPAETIAKAEESVRKIPKVTV